MADIHSHVTTNHDEIKSWIKERGGVPATVSGTERGGEGAGLLRVKFPEVGRDEQLEEISWDDFFDKFEESNLAFLYQEATREGEPSRFNKFVDREEHSEAEAA